MNYCIFDVESRVDKRLLREAFPELLDGIDLVEFAFDEEKGMPRSATKAEADQAALEAFHNRFRFANGRSPLPPLACHIPIVIAYGKVLPNLELVEIEASTTERLIEDFWDRYERFDGTLISFNGRGYDLPLLELHAMRLGLQGPKHMSKGRDRYRATRHIDLQDRVTNFGALRLDMLRGGLDLLVRFLGGPPKSGIDGSMVQEYWEAGEIEMIASYCGQDVLRTYLLFLRIEMFQGNVTEERVRELEAAAIERFAE